MASRLLTIVFVDVEASTELLTRAGDEPGTAAIDRLFDVVRERLDWYDGREVKALGDGLMLVFESPRSAVSFSAAVQQALAGRLPKLRVGMHFGETVGPVEDSTGETVSAAARLTERARGGEIVVSDVVRRLVGSIPRIRFVDRGRSHLKGFADAWQIHAVVAGSVPQAPPPAFGRDAELQRIDEMVASVNAGSGQILLIEGEAGIGKTHLARAAGATAAGADVTVVSGGADELQRDRPGLILGGLARELGIPLTDLQASADTGDGRATDPAYAVVERFVDALENIAAAGPVVLVVEDLHWADELSLRGIAAVARRVAPLPLGLIATLRPAPRSPYLHRVLDICASAGASTLTLSGLDEAGVAGLVASLTGGAPGTALRRRLGTTAGNPLFVTELIRALDDEGALQVETGVTDTDETRIPDELVRTLSRRVSTLPTEAVEVLQLASLLGGEFVLTDLATVAGRSVVEVATLLRDAVDAALLTGTGDRLSFRHDLIREAVYEGLPRAIRNDLHLSAARSLAAAGAPAQQVARQYALGARPGDLAAGEWLVRAAHEALHLDTRAASSLLEQALALGPDDWTDRRNVEAQLIQLLSHSGRVEEAREMAESLLGRSLTPEDELVARRALGSVLGVAGLLAEAAEQFRTAATLPTASETERGILTCAAGGMCVIAGTERPEDVAVVARDHLDTEDTALACWAHNTLAVTAVATARYDDLLHHARIARDLVEATYVPPLGFLIPHTWVAAGSVNLDDIEGTREATQVARRRAEDRGDVGLLMHAMTMTVAISLLSGRWDSATSEADATLILAEETGDHAQTLFHHAAAALVAFGRGDREIADVHIDAGEAFFSSGSQHPYGLDLLLWARAQLLEADGRADEARAVLAAVWEQTANLRGLVQWRHFAPDLVRLTKEAGDLDGARRIVEEIEELAGRSTSRSATAAAARVRGLVDSDPEQIVAAVEALEHTINVIQTAGAAEDAGVVLLRAGRPEDAAAMLDRAASLHQEMGALGHLARVDALLREAGVRRRRSPAGTATRGWESLSPKEREVVTLVSEGLSNPQIGERLYISRRTVETHLSHIFQKLELSNRTQLATAVLQRATDE